MKPGFAIAAAFLLVAFAAASWDVWVTYNPNGRVTVSSVINEWSNQLPILRFLAGMLAMHLFSGHQ